MSILGVCMFTEPIFYRGRHGQESEEGKEDREGSHQEGGKEDFQEKEVVVSTTEGLRLRVTPRTQSETSPKGYETSFAAVRYRGKVRKGRTFVQLATA
jgi:FKBP-type peptidyl-prolyl cis-trans isomerase